MPCGRRIGSGTALTLFLLAAAPAAAPGTAPPAPVHVQRYCMGTMFHLFAYHAFRPRAEEAIERAWTEIVRLDRVMSRFRADSDLSRLNRQGHWQSVVVDPSLVDVARQSVELSERTGGLFDVSIGPLLRTWREAHAGGRRPANADIEAAKRCVGWRMIEIDAPDRIRFDSDCLEIDLGGVGKGYAVDRAIAVLRANGISDALVNAGGSSIAATGAPPGSAGWPIRLGAPVGGSDVLLLRDRSMSTSEQRLRPFAFSTGRFGEILDPRTGSPVEARTTMTVVARSGTAAEALTKALLMLPVEEAPALLARFPDASALWIAPDGRLTAAYGESRLELAAAPEDQGVPPLLPDRARAQPH